MLPSSTFFWEELYNGHDCCHSVAASIIEDIGQSKLLYKFVLVCKRQDNSFNGAALLIIYALPFTSFVSNNLFNLLNEDCFL